MKSAFLILCTALISASATSSLAAKSCAAMKKELAELRREYRQYATSKTAGSGEPVKFERLAEILDKIADLKSEMKNLGDKCLAPPRSHDLKERR